MILKGRGGPDAMKDYEGLKSTNSLGHGAVRSTGRSSILDAYSKVPGHYTVGTVAGGGRSDRQQDEKSSATPCPGGVLRITRQSKNNAGPSRREAAGFVPLVLP